MNRHLFKSTLIFLYAFLLFCKSNAQESQKDFVKNDGISSLLHRNNLGKITFTQEDIPLENYKRSDFLKSYVFTPNSELFMTIFMRTSLTNYLHKLAPELTADSLAHIGNYQFSFYVDNHKVYQDNLHPGAPYTEEKHKQTILKKPLIDHPFSGWWTGYLWERFMNNAGRASLTGEKHLLKMEIRPYIKKPNLIVGELIASGQLEIDIPKIDIQKIKDSVRLGIIRPYKGLKVSPDKYDKDKIKELKAKIEVGAFRDITSIIVLKNDKILIEEYFNGMDRNSFHDVRSVGKSFASTVTGISIDEGFIENEDLTIKDFYNLKKFANYSVEKEKVLLKDLLTMGSNFAGNDDIMSSHGNEDKMYPMDNWVKFTLDLPMEPANAGNWKYFTAGVVLLGDIIDRNVPKGLEKYADAKLFRPLGITNYTWQYTPQKVANTAGGIQMNSLDFAKYGQLYKNYGKWEEKQVVSKEWIDKTFTKHKIIPDRDNEFYGYLFWNKKYEVNGIFYETFYCAGNGGNKIFVFNDLPLVVVVTATAYGMSYAHKQVDEIMEDYILPAILYME